MAPTIFDFNRGEEVTFVNRNMKIAQGRVVTTFNTLGKEPNFMSPPGQAHMVVQDMTNGELHVLLVDHFVKIKEKTDVGS